MPDAIIAARGHEAFQRHGRRRRSLALRPGRVDLRLHRTEWLRQDDDPQDDHAHPAAGPGRDRSARIARYRGRARSGRLPAGRTRPLQEDDHPPPAALLRTAQRRHTLPESTPRSTNGCSASSCPACSTGQSKRSRRGCRRRCSSSSAVVSNPSLLILDEPFSGLDPVNAQVVKDAVLEVRRRGTTVVFSTHDMSTAERCATAFS